MKFLLGSIVVVLLVGLSTQDTHFTKCNEALAYAPYRLQINDCTKAPCVVRKGTSFNGEVNFKIRRGTSSLMPKLTVGIGWFTQVMNFPQRDACVGLKNSKCPLKTGQRVTYRFAMPIPSTAPSVNGAKAKFVLKDDDGQTTLCFNTQLSIQ